MPVRGIGFGTKPAIPLNLIQGGLIRFDSVATPPVNARARRPRRARVFCMAASNSGSAELVEDTGTKSAAPVPSVTTPSPKFGEEG